MKFVEYVKGVRSEAGKVVFPTGSEVKKDTITTLAFCAGAALLLWGVSEVVILVISVLV